jgi:hypothetical protein
MSGPPLTADASLRCGELALGAKNRPHALQQTALLFDDLVGAAEQRDRDRDTERFGGLEVDHELEPGRLLDGQIARPLTLENAAGVMAGLAMLRGAL